MRAVGRLEIRVQAARVRPRRVPVELVVVSEGPYSNVSADMTPYSDEGGFHVPESAGELCGLWEQAMYGEPRWSADHPSSAFRKGSVVVRGPWPERVVVHKCMDPDEVPTWLDRLVSFLSDERFTPEVRAACGLGLLDWVHPFTDGNGHTGRLLMLAMLSDVYSQPMLVCLAHELVVNRAATTRQFRQLRERKGGADGFCLGMIGRIRDAQERALGMAALGSENE